MNINNSSITLTKTKKVYTWQEWIALLKESRYNILMIDGPGDWRENE